MQGKDIASQIESYVTGLTFRHFYLPLGNQTFSRTASLQPYDRLVIVLEGEKKEPMEFFDGIRQICLEPGDVYLVTKNHNEFQSWETPHKLLCIVVRPKYLRIAVHDVPGNSVGYDPSWTSLSFHTGHPPGNALLSVFNALKDRSYSSGPHIPLLLHAVVMLAVQECLHSPAREYKAIATFNEICTYLDNHFDEPLTREGVARQFGLNPQYISQLFAKISGESFLHYLTQCRLTRAQELLYHQRLTIKEIAMATGFKTEIYFIRRFRELVGVSPGKFRLQRQTIKAN